MRVTAAVLAGMVLMFGMIYADLVLGPFIVAFIVHCLELQATTVLVIFVSGAAVGCVVAACAGSLSMATPRREPRE